MKSTLLLIGPFGPGQLAESYARAFARLGFEVCRFDSDRAYFESAAFARNRYFRRAFRFMLWDRMNRATIAAARAAKPHAVMVIKGAYLHAATVRGIRQELGVPLFNYYPDNPYCGVPLNPRKTSAQRRDLVEVLKEYTRVWTWENALARRLQSHGVSAGYLPFGVDDEIFRPDATTGSPACAECDGDHRVVFVGQHSDEREEHVCAVTQRVALWGSRWPRASARFRGRHAIHQAEAYGGACAALYAAADVALNIVDELNMPGHNMRTFEIAGSGGVMLSRFTGEQAGFFPEGEAAVYYRTPEELDESLGRLREDRLFRDRLRRNALAIAREHTYERRAAAMSAELGLS